MKPNNALNARLARLGRHVSSPRSAHAPAAFLKLAPLAVLTVALALLVGVVHGATGAHAMPAPLFSTQTAASVGSAVSPPTHVGIGLAKSELNVLEGHRVRVVGVLRPVLVHEPVALQARDRGHWHTVARTRTGARGHFVLRLVPRAPTTIALRVATPEGSRRLGLLNVYREVDASWYGGGGSLACGGELTSSTLGVANKTLPCGTLVTLRYDGHTVRVPVVDRGPYVEGREFDLTEATKQALGFAGVAEVWSTS